MSFVLFQRLINPKIHQRQRPGGISLHLFPACSYVLSAIAPAKRLFHSIEDEVAHANQQNDAVRVQHTPLHGWGVFALRDFSKGDLVIRGKALATTDVQASHTIQTGWNSHVYMDLPARFVNHSCGSTMVGIRENNHGAYDFVALQSIAKEDEVVWDYECSEYELENGGFVCLCGSPNCRGTLRGFRHHGNIVMDVQRKDNVARYLFTEGRVETMSK